MLIGAGVLLGPAVASAVAQPVNNIAPEVVGNPIVGERIVCGAGSWSGAVSTFTYRWLRDGIPVASGVTYQVSSADKGHLLWCVVTASGAEGSAEAESGNSLSIGGASATAPLPTIPPVVAGTPAPGQTLECSPGIWSGSPVPTFTYQWLRDGAPIALATAATYQVAEADQGHTVSCRVTATNTAGQASAVSSNSLRVPGSTPANSLPPRVLGIEPASVSESLTCSPGSWSGNPPPTFAYRWIRDRGLPGETTIEAALGATFTVGTADQLHSLSCIVTATNSEGSAEVGSSNAISVHGSAPANVAPPVISGTVDVGRLLTCSAGAWTGVPAPSLSFLWIRDRGGAGEEAVSSSSVYVVRSGDAGHSLSCAVTAKSAEGEATQASEPVVLPAGGGSPPESIAAPQVSGTPALGATLSCSEGTWGGSPAPRLAYRWLRDGSTITAATANSYLVVEADEGHAIACEVLAINQEGIASATSSNTVQIPGSAPVSVEAPSAAGIPAVGQQLACAGGKWSGAPAPTLTYTWLRDGAFVPGATAAFYAVVSADRGTSLICRVTATNSAGSAEATSNAISIPGTPPHNEAAPDVSGPIAVGGTLTCSPGAWTGAPAPTLAYQWLLNGTAIPLATANRYVVAISDRGYTLSCRVTASNREGSEAAFSRDVHVPGVPPLAIEAPRVSGTGAVSQPVTCLKGTWNGAPPPVFTYVWLRDGALIASATSSVYTPEPADVGHVISCRVTATNREGTATADSSGGVSISFLARPTSALELASPPPGPLRALVTGGQINASLQLQLTRAQNRVRLASLRKTRSYSFPFTALAAGGLTVFWYQATGTKGTANAKQVLLAQASTGFTSTGTKTVKVSLTAAGRRAVGTSKRLVLTVRAVFRPVWHPVSWTGKFVLNR